MKNRELTLVSTTEPDWFHLIDEATEAIKFKLRSNVSAGPRKVWDVFERLDTGFCYRGQCVGAKPNEAILDYSKRLGVTLLLTVRAEF